MTSACGRKSHWSKETRSDANLAQLECIAIVWTELQQVMLAAILQQQGWTLKLVFVREGIRVLGPLEQIGARIVRVPNLSYSVHLLEDYRRVERDIVCRAIEPVGEYRFLSWTLEHPLAKGMASRPACKCISLFEDGTGSYLDLGRFSWRHGLKYLLTKLLINLALWRGRGLLNMSAKKRAEIWSLFPNPLPGRGIQRRVLRRESFRGAMQAAKLSESAVPTLPKGGILYLPSPFADCDLMTDAAEIAIHVDALGRFLDHQPPPAGPVLWKSHPRAIPHREAARLGEIRKQLAVHIHVVPADLNIEQILLANQEVELSVVSVASSAIYTLVALAIPRHRVVCMDSRLLRAGRPHLNDLYQFFGQIGIQVV